MRAGANPAKAGIPAYTPRELGVALITYIPFTEGYFKHSLQILKYQIECLRASTRGGFDLLVFDNGSCSEITAELKNLHARKTIDWLILSQHNMGKAGAWNWIFSAMPNDLICYADSDVLFRPGWLEASLAVLQAFPRAGMVSAQPNFYDVMDGQGKAHLNLQDSPDTAPFEYWPENGIIAEYCLGIGASEEVAATFHQKSLPALLNSQHQIQAVIGASHMQFIMPRPVARQAVPLPATRGLLRTETMALDFKVDALGYLHLSTTRPFVFHMGNTINERLLAEIGQITARQYPAAHPSDDSAAGAKPAHRQARRPVLRALAWLAGNPRFQPYLLRAYNLLFQALYSNKQR